MYVCSICRGHVGPRQPLLKHILYRDNGQIEREIPVCPECKEDLTCFVRNGKSPENALRVMLEEHQGTANAGPRETVRKVRRNPLIMGRPVSLVQPIKDTAGIVMEDNGKPKRNGKK